MKQISKWLAASLLLTASASQGIAQNLNKHFYRAENVSIDYLRPSDEYALGGHTYPYDIDGMLNISPATGLPFRRIQLEEIDKKPRPQMVQNLRNGCRTKCGMGW